MNSRWGAAFALALALSAGACKGDHRPSPAVLVKGRDAAPVVFIDSPTSKGALVDESEPNDDRGGATTVVLGAGGKGSLDGETDVDWYRFELDREGQLFLTVSGIEGVDLMLEVTDAQGESLAKSDRGPAMVVEGVANLPMKAGIYYVSVAEFVKKRPKKKKAKKAKKGSAADEGRIGPSPAYQLELTWRDAAADDLEREPNDTLDGAREMLLGDQFRGFLGWSGDRDVWKLSLEGFTADYTLDLDVQGVPDSALTLEVLDGSGKVVSRGRGGKGAAVATRNLVPATGEGASTYHYARLSGDRSNPLDAYTVKVSTRLVEPDEEVEPNDKSEQAYALRADVTLGDGRVRGFATAQDEDLYALTASADPMTLDTWVTPSVDFDAVVEVEVAGALVASGNSGKLGAREELLGIPVAANTSVIIRVKGELADVGAGEYELKWALRPGAVPNGPDDPPFPVEE